MAGGKEVVCEKAQMRKIVRHPGLTRLARTQKYLEQRGSWEEQPQVELETVMWGLASYAEVFESIGSLGVEE